MQQLLVILPIKYNGCNPLLSINTGKGPGGTRGLLMFFFFYLIVRAVSEERGEARTRLLPALLYRLFIYKDSGWTTAHPLGGGGRREERRSFILRQRHHAEPHRDN